MRAAEPPSPGPAGDGPLADDELDDLFAPLAGAERIGLAVSGGGDSLALLDAVDRWRRKRGRPEVLVFTVDHGLRKGSRNEAAAVAKIAAAREMKSRVLTWRGAKPKSDIEAAARVARYRLLIEACRDEGATHLVVAHHRDDLAETFLLRLKRGAGVFGLAAMRPWLAVGDVILVRPLLGISRARLAATTTAARLTPIDDPMNSDPRFERTRVRRLLPLMAAEGIDPARLAETALRLADAADAIDRAATGLLDEAVEVDALSVAWLTAAAFASAPQAVRMRALWRLLIAVGGDDYPPRHDRLLGIAEGILTHDGVVRFKRTLAGCVVEWRGRRFAFYREAGRAGLPSMTIRAGFTCDWDHRFAVAIGKGTPAGVSLGPLGEDGRRVLGIGATVHPAAALAALPAFRRRGEILAVPSLSEGHAPWATVRSILTERLQRLPLFPDLAAAS